MGFIEFLRACSANDCKTLEQYLEPSVSVVLNANIYYAMPPGFILPLPLVEAARYNARECAELLVKHGADPDLISNSRKSEKNRQDKSDRNGLKIFRKKMNGLRNSSIDHQDFSRDTTGGEPGKSRSFLRSAPPRPDPA